MKPPRSLSNNNPTTNIRISKYTVSKIFNIFFFSETGEDITIDKGKLQKVMEMNTFSTSILLLFGIILLFGSLIYVIFYIIAFLGTKKIFDYKLKKSKKFQIEQNQSQEE